MRFGEFLEQQGVVSAGDVLAALQKQRLRQMFLPAIAVELGFMTEKNSLRVLDAAEQQGRGFLDVAWQEGHLQQQQLITLELSRGYLLGSLLVEMGCMSQDQCNQQFKRFCQRDSLAGGTIQQQVSQACSQFSGEEIRHSESPAVEWLAGD